MHTHLASLAVLLAAAAPVVAQSSFGTSCIDSAGGFPSVSYPASSWLLNPSVNERVTLLGAVPSTAAVLFVGADPIDRLNVDLGIIGATGCSLYVSPFAQIPATVQPDGTAEVALGAVPFGTDFLFQWAMIDLAAPRPLAIVTTDALVAGVPTQSAFFRITDLDLRDPHVFFPIPILGCQDITDSVLFGLFPALNPSIQDAITTDADGDLFLDLNLGFVFRPLDTAGAGGTLDFVGAACSAPIATTACSIADAALRMSYTNGPASCLAPVPGSTRPYSPAVAAPSAPCFTSSPVDLAFDFGGIAIPLENVQFGATYVGNPVTALSNGLMVGFLPEASANAVTLPAALGGAPLSSLFAGGMGSYTGGDDRDVGPDGTTPGWWFYFNFRADLVTVLP